MFHEKVKFYVSKSNLYSISSISNFKSNMTNTGNYLEKYDGNFPEKYEIFRRIIPPHITTTYHIFGRNVCDLVCRHGSSHMEAT